VYQILSYERMHEGTQTSHSESLNRYSSAYLHDVIRYGPYYLTDAELEAVLRRTLAAYYEYLGVRLLERRGKSFWDYHRRTLEELGHPLKTSLLLRGLATRIARGAVNQGESVRKGLAVLSRVRSSFH
jgi:hypothetical protein